MGELSPWHQKLIEDSAISPEVAEARGYRTVTIKAELEGLGFSRPQRRTPALLIPIRGVDGEVVNYQLRPDEPRVVRGKALRYETPKGSSMVLDVPPVALPHLGDPKQPLFITEGARKADAGVSQGLCTIALLGVWNFRGTNKHGGKTALADWESIALEGRETYLVFDSDVMTKSAVHLALARLRGFLERKKASVKVISLPAGDGAAKVGLDDYLAAGHSVDDLLACATDELHAPEGSRDTRPYRATDDHRTVYLKPDRDGETVSVPLANFVARIEHDVIEDDGAERRRLFGLRVEMGSRTTSFEIPAEQFGSMNWVTRELGPAAILTAGNGMKDRLREAIQVLSEQPIPVRRIYTHLGWVEQDGEWVYLHAGGGIGRDGAVRCEVRLEAPLDLYVFPEPPEGDELKLAVRASLGLLDGLVSDAVAFPLFSAIWRAALGDTDFTVHLVGTTGVRKTELAALGQRHYGEGMDARNLPGSWSSTANYNETLAFLAKDALLVVDDFKPTGSGADVLRKHREADLFLRATGNGSGRGRMRSDGTLRAVRPPRSLILSTGEDVPAGHSLRARTFVIEVGAGDVNLSRLTACQAAAESYPKAHSAFLRWSAARLPELRAQLRRLVTVERDKLLGSVPHGRTATIAAELLAGLHLFLRFARESGVLFEDETIELGRRAQAAIRAGLSVQAEQQKSADPVRTYLDALRSALSAGEAHLVDSSTGDRPSDDDLALEFGWHKLTSEAGAASRTDWRSRGPRVGWIRAEDGMVCLDPRAAYKTAQAMAEASGMRLPLGEHALRKALDEAGVLADKDADRKTKKTHIGGSKRNLLHIQLEVLRQGPGTSGT